MSFVESLTLRHFRSYEHAELRDLSNGAIVLTGHNGAGKTNLLEAVSLLAPGRGLRGMGIDALQKHDTAEPWVVAAALDTPHGPAKIGTGCDPARPNKRTVRINGAPARRQSDLSEWFSCVWLTPQMDHLFLDSAGSRRRFLDRLIFAFDPGHAGRTTRYEKALAQRSKILKDETTKPDPLWLKALEAQIVETGIAVTAARLDFITRLRQAVGAKTQTEAEAPFPQPHLHLSGTLEELLEKAPALEVEELYAYQLAESRIQDALTGGAATGPHRSDLIVTYSAKNMPAAHCSTGEQKALLIGLVLAHARLIAAERGAPPVLLLDEVAAHLDENRRALLFDILIDLGGQVWLTGTDTGLFSHIKNKGIFCAVAEGQINQGR